jgi:hypothetical protein
MQVQAPTVPIVSSLVLLDTTVQGQSVCCVVLVRSQMVVVTHVLFVTYWLMESTLDLVPTVPIALLPVLLVTTVWGSHALNAQLVGGR